MSDSMDGLAGIDGAVMQRLAAETGLTFTYERAGEAVQAATHLQAGELDALVGIDNLVETPHLLLSAPFMRFPLVFVAKDDAPFLLQPGGANKFLLAVPKSLSAGEWWAKNPKVHSQIYDTPAAALAAVANGHATGAIVDLATASYVIRSEKRQNLKLVGVLERVREQQIAIRGDWPELRAILNKAIGSLSAEDNQVLSRLWISQDGKTSTHWTWIALILAALSSIAAVVGGLFILRYHQRVTRLTVERKRLLNELSSVNQRATSLHGEKTEVLRIALQHFDRPVTEVASLAGRLATVPLKDHEILESAVEIGAQNARMRQSLDVLREMQSIADNSRRLVMASINVGAVVKEALVDLEIAATKKRVRLSAPSPAKTWLVRADLDTLRKVIESLVGAAIKASPSGSAVSVALWQAEDRVLMTVSDEGPGLAVSDETELYGRPGQSSSPLEGGEKSATYGLGLVRNLVMAMDGWLWCDSDLGRGTTFVVELPVVKEPSESIKTPRPEIVGLVNRRRSLQPS